MVIHSHILLCIDYFSVNKKFCNFIKINQINICTYNCMVLHVIICFVFDDIKNEGLLVGPR